MRDWVGKLKAARKRRQAIPRLELLEDRCLLSAAVAIVTNPISATVVAGHTATFSAAATGSPTPTVQWEMSPKGGGPFVALVNNATYSGVGTGTLTVTGAATTLSGDEFEAVFSNGVLPTPTVPTTAAMLTVNPLPTIGPLTQGTWTIDRAGFDGTMTIAGGIGPFSIVSASTSGLPIGLTPVLTGNTITFTGTPTVVQAFSGSITIQDAVGDQTTQTVSISINAPPTISHMSTNNWTQGLANFTGAMTIRGGAAPFSIVSNDFLPPGVTPVISGNLIRFTGVPSVAKTYSDCTVTIADASGATATKVFVIAVEPALIVGNLTQTQWTVGQPGFTGALAIGGGTGSYSLVTSASTGLPTGLTAMVSGGTVHFTGTPTQVGAFPNGSVTVTDADGAVVTQTFAITINAAPTLSPLTTLQWTAGTLGYTGTVAISGGTGPYTISSYAYLPFSAAVSGHTVYFTGTAPERVYYGATFTIRDKSGATATQTNTISVNPVVTLSSLTSNAWTVGQVGFNGAITINYGTQPFTITSFTGLPTGLTPVVSGATITFTGTPTVAGAFSAGNIAMEDSGGGIFNVPVDITINPPLTFSTTALPAVIDGVAYGATLKTAGGSGGDIFALTGGSILPTGLTLQSNGHISGASSATGTFTFSAGVTDATGAQASDTFTIAAGPAAALGNLTQTQWTVGQAGFTGALAIKGGVGPFTLILATGLPPGLTATLSGRTVSFTGTPSVIGTSASGNIIVVDADGVSASETISITINAAPTLGSLAAIPWTAGVSGYTSTILISGGTGPYTIASFTGLPFTPIASGNTILFTGSGSAGVYANGVITLRDKAGATVTANIATIVINAAPTVSHMSTNNWTEGAAGFPGTMTISGGSGPFTIVTTKNVPLGLTPNISGNLIEFTGTPEVAETVEDCSVTIRDAAGAIYTKIFVLDIAMPLSLTTTHLPAWSSGVSYATTLAASGGTGTRTFTLTAGSLPPGLTLKSGGRIVGTATAVGSFTFTVTVTDSIGDKSIETYTL
jgi:hypothetical protein